MDDLAVAEAAVRAAADAALEARASAGGRLTTQTKGVSANVVTEADRAAEAAAARVIARQRPGDAVLGEEGTDTAGARWSPTAGAETGGAPRSPAAGADTGGGRRSPAAGAETGGGRRRWLIDGIDGTVSFAAGLAGGWCSAVALEDGDGPLAAAVLDPATGELAAAARGRATSVGGRAARMRAARPLAEAHVATFLRRDRLVAPGVRETGHALFDAAGLVRHAGPGSLELAWVAAGRLDGWMQPEVDPWDWLPGALLVREAGGEARVVQRGARWHLAGPAALLDELERLIR